MNITRKPGSHIVTLDPQEAYAGYDCWCPSDRSVQEAVESLIFAHEEEFQELIDNAEARAREQSRIDAAEYMMEESHD